MDKILNFQLSLFGSFINIKPNNDITMRLIANLQEDCFLPGTVDIAVVDTDSKKINSESRLQMVSQDKFWNIVFLQERIDLNYNYVGGSICFTEFNTIFEYARGILEKVFNVFPDTTGNRLAVNGKILLPEMTSEERFSFIDRFSKPLKLYGDAPITEWNLRLNAHSSMGIAEGINEMCNSIIEIGDCFGYENGSPTQRILLSLDTNTIPENRDLRFTYKNLLYFSNDAEKWMTKALAEIEED